MTNNISEPIHPLFLPEDDDDAPQVSEIQISRMENGQPVFAPRVRPAAELQSLEQIVGEFGGGTYILIARHEGRISTRRKMVLPGKPKPMYDEGPKEEPQTVSPVVPTMDPMMAMMGGMGGSSGGAMPFFMMMMQQMNQAADRQMQLVIAMMQGGRESSSEDKANARAEMQANIERERIAADKQMAMMREMMTLMQAGKSGGGSEEFTKGVEFMRTFATQQVEMAKAAASGDGNSELGSLLETLGQAFQAAQAVGMFKGGGGLPEGVAQVAEAAQ